MQRIWWSMLASVLLLLAFSTMIPAYAQEDSPADEAAEEIVEVTVNAAEETANTIEEFTERLVTSPQSDVARVLMVIGGIVLLVAGWRVYDFIIIISGFLMGASLALALVAAESTLVALAAFLLGGLVGAALAVLLYYVAVFLIGAYVGTVLTAAGASALSLTPISALALLVGAIIGGLLLLAMSFELLIVLSAIVGAQMLVLGLGLDTVWILLFALAGVAIQFLLVRSFNYKFRRQQRSRRVRLTSR